MHERHEAAFDLWARMGSLKMILRLEGLCWLQPKCRARLRALGEHAAMHAAARMQSGVLRCEPDRTGKAVVTLLTCECTYASECARKRRFRGTMCNIACRASPQCAAGELLFVFVCSVTPQVVT